MYMFIEQTILNGDHKINFVFVSKLAQEMVFNSATGLTL